MNADRSTTTASEGARRPDDSPSARGPLLAAAALIGMLGMGAASCADVDTGFTDPTVSARIDLAFEVPGATSSSVRRGRMISGRLTVSESDPSFVIDSVDVVMRELQLGRQGEECLFGSVGGDGDGGDGSDCVEFFIQSVIQTLPVDDGSEELVTNGGIRPGTFDRLAFRFNVLESTNNEETRLIGERGDLQGESLFVGGTFEGQEFEVRLDPDGPVVVNAADPLTLGEEESGRAVLVWDVASWFVDPEDGSIEDPTRVEGDDQLEQQVKTRIGNSLSARLMR